MSSSSLYIFQSMSSLTQWMSKEEAALMPSELIEVVTALLDPSQCSQQCISVLSTLPLSVLSLKNRYLNHGIVFFAMRRVCYRSMTTGACVCQGPCDETISQILTWLYGQGVALDPVDNLGQTPLFYAARDGRTKCCHALSLSSGSLSHIDRSSSPHVALVEDNMRQTAAFYAAREGRIPSMEALMDAFTQSLISFTAHVMPSSLASPPHDTVHVDTTVAQKKREEAISVILNKQDKHYQTPLFYACSHGHSEMILWILETCSHGSFTCIDILKRDSFRKRPRNYFPTTHPEFPIISALFMQLERHIESHPTTLNPKLFIEEARKRLTELRTSGTINLPTSLVSLGRLRRIPLKKGKKFHAKEPWVNIAREMFRSALFNCSALTPLAKNLHFQTIKRKLEAGQYQSFDQVHEEVLFAIQSTEKDLETQNHLLPTGRKRSASSMSYDSIPSSIETTPSITPIISSNFQVHKKYNNQSELFASFAKDFYLQLAYCSGLLNA